MLSSMETSIGLTLVSASGEILRVPRNNPVYNSVKAELQLGNPDAQSWSAIKGLLRNPLKALCDWCLGFGINLSVEGDNLKLNDQVVSRAKWLPAMQKTQAVAGSPKSLLSFLDVMGPLGANIDISNIALRVTPTGVAVLTKQALPLEVRVGDRTDSTGRGPVQCLVAYDEFNVQENEDGTHVLNLVKGSIASVKPSEDELAALTEPMTLGNGRTYQCQVGDAKGWLDDFSFDSLASAKANAQDMISYGDQARIVNRITGNVVAL